MAENKNLEEGYINLDLSPAEQDLICDGLKTMEEFLYDAIKSGFNSPQEEANMKSALNQIEMLIKRFPKVEG